MLTFRIVMTIVLVILAIVDAKLAVRNDGLLSLCGALVSACCLFAAYMNASIIYHTLM